MFKVGDLVQIKIPTERSNPEDIWLVVDIGVCNFYGFISVQNIHNGYTCQYNAAFLKYLKSDKK